MIRIHVVVAFAMILFGNMSFAQPHLYVNTVVMVTSDGNITVSDGRITFRDYVFKVESEEKENIWSLVDQDTGDHAILDVREDQGIYFTVYENLHAMQVVAGWDRVKMRGEGAKTIALKRMFIATSVRENAITRK
ncbi:MAG: hypothetical protein GXO82_06015 [Chlorobi bacterium]|nr:hypothetical protein [Chlorobiota bacterium]